MEKLRELKDCEHYPLCKHLQGKVRHMPSILLLNAIEIEAELICGECQDFEQKETLKKT